MYEVIVEWDGNKPPTKFYLRLHALAMRVRGDKEVSPVERRTTKNNENEDKALIIQEGAIITASESLGRLIYHLCVEYIQDQTGSLEKARSQVHFCKMEIVENMNVTLQDYIVLQHVQSTLGRKGRPPADELEDHDFVVTCSECVTTSYVRAKRVINCPNCYGFNINKRYGTVNTFNTAAWNGSLLDLWANTRWANGRFEIPISSDLGKPVPSSLPTTLDEAETPHLDIIANSQNLLSKIDNLLVDTALRFLDRVFVGRCYTDKEKANHARAEAAVSIFTRYPNFDASRVKLFGDAHTADLLDAAVFYSPDELADLFVTLEN